MISQSEIDTLQQLLGNEPLVAIVEKVLMGAVDNHEPHVKEGDTNLLLGEKYRGYQDGKALVQMGLENLKSYRKEVEAKTKSINKGR